VKGDAPARAPTCEDSSTEKLGLWGGRLAGWGWWLIDGGWLGWLRWRRGQAALHISGEYSRPNETSLRNESHALRILCVLRGYMLGGTSIIVISDVVYDHASFASDIDPSFFSL
jgi:hypothetical protein